MPRSSTRSRCPIGLTLLVPHGRRAGAQLAQDERGGVVATPRHPGVGRGGHRRALRRPRPARRSRRLSASASAPWPRPTAARALVLSVRAAQRATSVAWRGAGRRANGGMVVHLGVVCSPWGSSPPPPTASRRELALHRGRWSPTTATASSSRACAPSPHPRTCAEAAGEGRRRHVRSGHHQLRQCPVGRRHAGHRLGALRGRLPDLRRRGWSRRPVGQPGDQQPAAGVGGHRRRHRAAGGLAVGRGPPDRSRGPAGPRARDPSAGHRPGVGPLGSRDRHRTGRAEPSGTPRTRHPSGWGRSCRGVGRA